MPARLTGSREKVKSKVKSKGGPSLRKLVMRDGDRLGDATAISEKEGAPFRRDVFHKEGVR